MLISVGETQRVSLINYNCIFSFAQILRFNFVFFLFCCVNCFICVNIVFTFMNMHYIKFLHIASFSVRPLSRTPELFSAGCSKIQLASRLRSARHQKFGWRRRQHFPAAARLESVPLSQHTNKRQLSVVVGLLLILMLDSTTTNEKCSHCNSAFGRLFLLTARVYLTLFCVNFILQIIGHA